MYNPLDVIDCYSIIDKKYTKKLRTYPNEKILNISIPARFLITGGTGSMKTNSVRNVIRSMGCFERIYLFAKKTDEPLYAELAKICAGIGEELGECIFFASNTLDDLPSVDSFNPYYNNLIIIDDMIGEKDKMLKNVADLWIRGRRENCSTIFITQSFYKCPKLIRDNTNYFIFKRMNGNKDIMRIWSEFSGTKTVDEINRMYNNITKKNKIDWFMVDTDSSTPQLTYRKNYVPAFTD
jgi:hypothetical protein